MQDEDRQAGAANPRDTAPDLPDPDDANAEALEETLIEEVGALIDDGRTYAQAEIAFQKSRAKLAGRTTAIALVQLVLALILLHIAFLALAVGLVIALTPLVSVWGAIAMVVGGLLLLVILLVAFAARRGKQLGALFSSDKEGENA